MATEQKPTALAADEIENRLLRLRGWKQDEDSITRTFKFRDFKEAKSFVDRVADAAERAEHHPDIELGYGKVRLTLSTHSAGGLTEKDFALAEEIDRLGVDR